MPHYGIFFMIGGGGISYLVTSILPLREINPHYGIFVMIRGWGCKLSDQFYSAPLRVFTLLWCTCHD